MTPLPKRWELFPAMPPAQALRLASVPEAVCQILYNRGLTDPEEVHAFLSEGGAPLGDPFQLKDMHRAVDRIRTAIGSREPVVVYGDFDADGITSAALLVETLQSLGAACEPYIPHRLEEGYGLNRDAIQRLADREVRLLLTVDCGISAVEEVACANALGMDVIITDHHHVPAELPQALAVINPRQRDCPYPFKGLAGVGVAFKLAQAVLSRVAGVFPGRSLDLVALGTVADLAPLLDENRTLVKRGLQLLNPPERLGLQEMILRAGLQKVEAGTIGYVLGPRLNATGRLDSAMSSLRLLLTDNADEARELALKLEDTNQERQRLTSELQDRARRQVHDLVTEEKLLVISGPDYRAGVVGLVAGRIAEEFYRPTVVIEVGEETSRGSARSIAEFNIVVALDECQDLLVRYGGHAQAAGFTVESQRLEALRLRLRQIAERELAGKSLQPTLVIDVELPFSQVTWETLASLERLAPFGYANPTPLLLTRRLRVVGPPRVVGKDHLRLKLTEDGRRVVDAIGFRLGALADQMPRHPYWDVVYQLESNQWGDNPPVLQLNIRDMCPWRR